MTYELPRDELYLAKTDVINGLPLLFKSHLGPMPRWPQQN
jgi:hypothetical protein